MSTLAEIERAIEALPPVEIERLVAWIESRRPPKRQAEGWPSDYFERTAGSFAGEPLERPAQGTAEQRESW